MSTTEHDWTSSFERQIPSDSAEGKRLIDELLADLERLEWQEPDMFGVHLALEEAVVNAIKHGNRNDRSKLLTFSVNASPTAARITITDQGDGFNLADVPDPTDDENLELPSGRGLMLMRSFMTDVRFNEKGNQVTMEKHLTDCE